MKRGWLIAVICIGWSLTMWAQEAPVLRLDDCYRRALEVYPLSRQQELFDEQEVLQIKALERQYYPVLELGGEARYQSDVVQVGLESSVALPIRFPEVPHDNYKVDLGLKQLIYDGGRINNKKQISRTAEEINRAQLRKEQRDLKDYIHRYFSQVLLLQQQQQILEARQQLLQVRWEELRVRVENEMALQTDLDQIHAAQILLQQQMDEVESNRLAALSGLSVFLQQPVPPATRFEMPASKAVENGAVNTRPEWNIMTLQQQQLNDQKGLLKSGYLPRLGGFVTAGYGKPGLNLFSDRFDTYWLAGIQLHWKLWDGHQKKIQTARLDVQSKLLDTRKSTFKMKLEALLTGIHGEINKHQLLLEKDRELVQLRTRISATAASQLANGTITSSQYLMELDKETRARMEMELHRIALAMAYEQYAAQMATDF